MRITSFASGSSGNCSLFSAGGRHILIDAGISYKRVSDALLECGAEAPLLSGILITHGHSDHINGLPMLIKRLKIPVWAPAAVCGLMTEKYGAPAELLREITPGESIDFGELRARVFKTPHDAPGSVGYRFECGEGALGYCTDLGHVTDEVLQSLSGVNCALIECNHDTDMLKRGPYPGHLKRRILSDVGHLSNRLSAKLARLLCEAGAKSVILAHLSQDNNTPALAWESVTASLAESGLRAGRDIDLYIAPKDEPLTVCSR